jgi:hypothetical protein
MFSRHRDPLIVEERFYKRQHEVQPQKCVSLSDDHTNEKHPSKI